MEGLANDFAVTHLVPPEAVDKIGILASKICDRRSGIGGDGIILILPAQTPNADFRMRIINNDGSEAEMCGNGIRCVASYIKSKNIFDKNICRIETLAGIIVTELLPDGQVRVDMRPPILDPAKIPFVNHGSKSKMHPLFVNGKNFTVTPVSMGNPHCVIYTDELTDELVLGFGPKLERHEAFPKKTNVEFIKINSNDSIDMRVWERGCGETAACGTGACAAVVSGIINSLHGNAVTVNLRGGKLVVEWSGKEEDSVFMTGPARKVYTGEIDTEDFQ